MAHECSKAETIDSIRDDVKKLFAMSIPGWVRSVLIAAITALFIMYGSVWVWASGAFAAKEDMREIKADVKDLRESVSTTLREILIELRKGDR